MTLYTVHVPEDTSNAVSRADRAVFLREGFSVWAFVFGWVFLVWHRLWLAALAWLVVGGLVTGIAWFFHPPAGSMLALFGLMHVFLGIEGNDLRWRLGRRRYRLADIVSGAGLEEAEIGFFFRQPDMQATQSIPASRVVAQDVTPSVIGMFPDERGS